MHRDGADSKPLLALVADAVRRMHARAHLVLRTRWHRHADPLVRVCRYASSIRRC
jgi:hypothetical protein